MLYTYVYVVCLRTCSLLAAMLLCMKRVLRIFASVVVGGVVLFFLAAAFAGSPVIGVALTLLLVWVLVWRRRRAHGERRPDRQPLHRGAKPMHARKTQGEGSSDGSARVDEEKYAGLGFHVQPRPDDYEETPQERETRFRRSYLADMDCTPCNAKPDGMVVAEVEDCRGVDVGRRQDHQDLFARYGKGAWMWVWVTRSHVQSDPHRQWPTIEVWLDGESAGYLTPLQTSRHYLQVPEDGCVTQAHIRQDPHTGRYHMRVELPPKHMEIDLSPYIIRDQAVPASDRQIIASIADGRTDGLAHG